MSLNQWIAVIMFFDLVAILTVLAVVHGGTRKPTPCTEPADELCIECQLERL